MYFSLYLAQTLVRAVGRCYETQFILAWPIRMVCAIGKQNDNSLQLQALILSLSELLRLTTLAVALDGLPCVEQPLERCDMRKDADDNDEPVERAQVWEYWL